MSRIAKLPITILENVNVALNGDVLSVSGSKGSLTGKIASEVDVKIESGKIMVSTKDPELDNLAGMTRTNIANMIKGVNEGWSKTLELNGTGYRATTTGGELQLALGFSHPINLKAPSGITFEVKENKITVKGADKALVGELAAKIRKMRPADPYKAKGFKYEGEVIVRKAGKAAKAGGAAGGK